MKRELDQPQALRRRGSLLSGISGVLVGIADLLWFVVLAVVFMYFPNLEYQSSEVRVLDGSVFAIVVFATMAQLLFGEATTSARRGFLIMSVLPNFFLVRSAVLDEAGNFAPGNIWISIIVVAVFVLQVFRVQSFKYRPLFFPPQHVDDISITGSDEPDDLSDPAEK